MKTILLASALTALISAKALAGPTQKWEGTGSVYSPDGQQLSTYKLTVVNTEVGPDVTESQTTVTTAKGPEKVISQKIRMNGSQWTLESSLGKGGGSCYGVDLCENYITGKEGKAYATTIIMDGPNQRRDMTIKLQDGKAVQILRDQLTRVQ